MKVQSVLVAPLFILITILASLLPLTGVAASGDLDADFGRFGDSGSISLAGMSTRDMALLPDGKILAIGSSGSNLIIRRFRANGDSDQSFGAFGSNGQETINLGSADACGYWASAPYACGVAVYADGRFVVVAEYSNGGDSDFAILRFLANGALDASFGIGGLVTVDFTGRRDYPNDVAIQADGKIVVVGTASFDPGLVGDFDYRFGVVRLNANGGLDTSFSSDGKLSIRFEDRGGNRAHQGNAISIQRDGKIVVAGKVVDYDLLVDDWDFGIARLNMDGSLDNSFSGNGKKTVGFGGDEAAFDISITPKGKIVVVGGASVDWLDDLGKQFAVTRLNKDGSLDNSFSGDGRFLLNRYSGVEETLIAVAVQPDGKLVAIGHADTAIKLIRLDQGGLLDSSFSDDGVKNLQIGGLARDLIIQPDGNFLLMYGDGITRLNPDLIFDSAGSVVTNFGYGDGDDRAYGIETQKDGKILVVGEAMGSNGGERKETVVVRYLKSGALDTEFGRSGMVSLGRMGDDTGRSVAVQKDEKIVVAGFGLTFGSPAHYDFYISRLHSNGSRDDSFNNRYIDFGLGSDDFAVKVLVQADDKIVAVGFAESGTSIDPNRMVIALARFLPNGDFDTSFNGSGKVLTPIGPGSTARARNAILQSDGKIIVVGVYERNMLVMRYHSNGTLDTGFGNNGIVLANRLGNEVGFGLGFIYGDHIAIGGIVDSSDFGVLILDPDGGKCTVCGLFANDQYWQLVDFGYSESAYGFAVQDNGRMVLVGGESSGDSGVFATRIRRNPIFRGPGFRLDTSFGTSGKTTHGSLLRSSARAVTLSGSNIYIAGYRSNGNDDDFLLMKLENDSETWPYGQPLGNLIFGNGFEDP